MDQIILNRNAEKWIEACQFLKSAEIKPQLDASEWTAVEGLMKTTHFDCEVNGHYRLMR